jgi:hypothetical protein
MKDASAADSICLPAIRGAGDAGSEAPRVNRRALLRAGAISLAGMATLSGVEMLKPSGARAQQGQGSASRVSNFVVLSNSVTTPDSVGPNRAPQMFHASDGTVGELADADVRLVRSIYRYDYRFDQPVSLTSPLAPAELAAFYQPQNPTNVVVLYRSTNTILGFPDPPPDGPRMTLQTDDPGEELQNTLLTGQAGLFRRPQDIPLRPEDVPANFPPAPPEPNSLNRELCYRLPPMPIPDDPFSVRIFEFCSFYAFAKSLIEGGGPTLIQGSQIDFKAEDQHRHFDVRANAVTAAVFECGGQTVALITAESLANPPSCGSALSGTGGGQATPAGGASPLQPLNQPNANPATNFPVQGTPVGGDLLIGPVFYGAPTPGSGRREATWTGKFTVAEGQQLTVDVYLPKNMDATSRASYTLSTAMGVRDIGPLDQSALEGWVSLGTFPFNPGTWYVTITDMTGGPVVTTPSGMRPDVLAFAVRWRA